MSISIKEISFEERVRILREYRMHVEECISIPTDKLVCINQFLRFLKENQITCAWVREGTIFWCVSIGDRVPEIMTLEQIRQILRQYWIETI